MYLMSASTVVNGDSNNGVVYLTYSLLIFSAIPPCSTRKEKQNKINRISRRKKITIYENHFDKNYKMSMKRETGREKLDEKKTKQMK